MRLPTNISQRIGTWPTQSGNVPYATNAYPIHGLSYSSFALDSVTIHHLSHWHHQDGQSTEYCHFLKAHTHAKAARGLSTVINLSAGADLNAADSAAVNCRKCGKFTRKGNSNFDDGVAIERHERVMGHQSHWLN